MEPSLLRGNIGMGGGQRKCQSAIIAMSPLHRGPRPARTAFATCGAQRPVSVERLRGESVVYRPLDEEKAVSPVIGRFPLIQKLIDGIYQKAGISFGV